MVSKENGDADFQDKLLGTSEKLFHLAWNNNEHQDIWHWLILITVAAGVILTGLYLTLKTVNLVIENLLKLVEGYKSSGLPIWQSRQNKVSARKRKQFCTVLDADLSYLAKVENWNDQYFTDLEAEVETEGGYYATAFDKLRRKKSHGLRKERSLIRAITTSTERAMQLVGEPGSGKSVALRHLAKQFAEQGKKSNARNAIVPLYVNLREMELNDKENVSADSVKEFILDNIRRGDADTSAYVRDNWDDYCNRGIWLFLFDSFDEIPAVLHAESGSNIIKTYSQALRQFLEGMGECRGILASREFKGPEALPWKKLRVLPLSGEKQDELIRNSFLDDSNMSMVRQHLANSHSSIGATPLFLTLLCRYVRDEHKPPTNDNDILFKHIDRLAHREPEYLLKKYNLTPVGLVRGAERLARLFAEEEKLSLAPSLDQIKDRLPLDEIPNGALENLISALVDSKIGRTDVPNAAPGDRRFAFAHRRYQESLFVRYLTQHPEIISPLSLLTETRWREYTVTLLQTREYEEFSELLGHASFILSECTARDSTIRCGHPPLPSDLIYYNWLKETAPSLLSLLQDGLAHRLQDVPYSLSTAVANYLKPRWENGDLRDRNEVLRLGGLLPHELLVKYLVETFSSGTKSEKLYAFRQTAFTNKLPEDAKTVVLKMLSNQVISSKDRGELLTIEALAARLPEELNAAIVVTRCKRLRRNFGIIKNIVPRALMINHVSLITYYVKSILVTKNDSQNGFAETFRKKLKADKPGFDLTFMASLLFTGWFVLLLNVIKYHTHYQIILFAINSALLISLIVMLSPFLVRHSGKKIGFIDMLTWVIRQLIRTSFLLWFLMAVLSFGVFLTASAMTGFVIFYMVRDYEPAYLYKLGDNTPYSYVAVGILFIFALIHVGIVIKIFVDTKRRRKKINTELTLLNKFRREGLDDISLLYSAENYQQLVFWLENDDRLLNDPHSIRTFSSFVLRVIRSEKKFTSSENDARPQCLVSADNLSGTVSNDCQSQYLSLRQVLENRLIQHSD